MVILHVLEFLFVLDILEIMAALYLECPYYMHHLKNLELHLAPPYLGCLHWEKMELLHVLGILAALCLKCPYYMNQIKIIELLLNILFYVRTRVSIRKTFAQFLRNKTQNFFLCASVLRRKTTFCAIIRKSHFAQNCPFPLLRNSSFAQFRNFVKIKRLVTVCVS